MNGQTKHVYLILKIVNIKHLLMDVSEMEPNVNLIMIHVNPMNVVNLIQAVFVVHVQIVFGKIILVQKILQNVKIMKRIHVLITQVNMV